MPTFTFKSPEGKSYDIKGPEGATQEQAWDILQAQIKPANTEAGILTRQANLGGDMGAAPGSHDREIAAATADLAKVKTPEERALLQGHIDEMTRQKTAYAAPTAPAPVPAPTEVPRIEISGTSADVPKPKGLWRSAVQGAVDLPTNLVVGAGKAMSYPLAPIDAGIDLATGQTVGTNRKERMQGLEDFRREHTMDPNTVGADVAQAIPEMILTKDVGGKSLIRSATGQGAISASKAAADNGDVIGEGLAGAAGGAAGHAFFRTLAGARSGLEGGMRKLVDKGYLPTVGQMTGKIGEGVDALAKFIPGMGGAVERSEKSAAKTFSRAATNEAIERVGGRTEAVGEDAVREGKAAVSKFYNQEVKPHIELTPRQATQAVRQSVASIQQDIPTMSPSNVRKLNDLVSRRIIPRGQAGFQTRNGEAYKELDSQLGQIARPYEGPNVSGDDAEFARAVRILQRNLRDGVRPTANAPAGTMEKLQKADAAWKEMVPVADASKRARAQVGAFSPTQLAAATDRANLPRSRLSRAGIEATPDRPSNSGMGAAAANMAPGIALGTGAVAALPSIAKGLAASTPSFVAGTGIAGGILGAHQLANTEVGRKVILNGLAGAVPASVLGKISGLPPREAQRALQDLLSDPQLANVAAQIGRRTVGE